MFRHVQTCSDMFLWTDACSCSTSRYLTIYLIMFDYHKFRIESNSFCLSRLHSVGLRRLLEYQKSSQLNNNVLLMIMRSSFLSFSTVAFLSTKTQLALLARTACALHYLAGLASCARARGVQVRGHRELLSRKRHEKTTISLSTSSS